MFIRLFDARANANMLLNMREIITVKDYITNSNETPIPNVKSVVMTRPLGDQIITHNYFVSESVTDIEGLLTNAIDQMF